MPIEILNYTLATAGHQGHGKSALLKALSGFTAPVTQSPSSLSYTAIRLKKYQLSIADVSGAAAMVGQMVAGVGTIDLAILVVAADQGWMPQTEEHFQILNYLCVERAIIAVTKIDLVDDVTPLLSEVKNRLENSTLAGAPIMPTSIVRGQSIVELKKELMEVVSRTLPQRDLGKPRLVADDIDGAMVTGTLVGGSLKVGQTIIVQPGGRTAQIRSATTRNVPLQLARPGARITLELSDIQPAVVRGDVITIPEFSHPSHVVDVQLTRAAGKSPVIGQGDHVCVHFGSATVGGQVHFLAAENLSPGEKTLARIRLHSPVLALMHDRFVVRDVSQAYTLAGGVILDPDPPHEHEGPRSLSQLAMLTTRAASPPNPANFMSSQLARDGVGERATFLMRSRFSQRDLDAAVDRLIASKSVVITGDIIANSRWWSELRRLTIEMIDGHHRDHPDKPGLPLTLLRPAAATTLPPNVENLARPLMDALIAELCGDGFARTSAVIHRIGHQLQVSPRLVAAESLLLKLLDENPLDPPSRFLICKSPVAKEAMESLITAGKAIDLAADVVVTAGAYGYAVDTIRYHLQANGVASVTQLLDLFASSRRVMVPLLERLDRENITQRDNGGRRLVARAIAGPIQSPGSTPPATSRIVS